MTTFFYDFSTETVGTLPSYMTLYSQSGDWTLTIQDESAVRGLRVAKTSSGSDPYDGVFTTVGSMDNSQAVEIVAQCKFRSGADTTIAGPTFLTMFMNYATDLASYSLTYSGNASTPRFEIIRRSSTFSSASVRGTYNMPGATAPTVDQIFRMRFRHQTDGVMRARMCFAANCTDSDELTEINALLTAAAQPTVGSIDEAKSTSQAWHVNGSADTTYTTGYFTVHGGTSNSYPFFGPYIGIATAGETAPTSASSGSAQAPRSSSFLRMLANAGGGF